MDHQAERPPDDLDPALRALLREAFVDEVDVETAARHLWALHRAAGRSRVPGPGTRRPDHARGRRRQPSSLRRRQTSRHRVAGRGRVTVVTLVAVMLLSMSGAAVAASRSSLPGDALYSVKRGTERAQLILALTPAAEAELQLQIARTRLSELVAISGTRPQLVPVLLADLSNALDRAEEAAPEIASATADVRREAEEQVASLNVADGGDGQDGGDVATPAPAASAAAPGDVATTATPTPTTSTEPAEASAEPTTTPTADPSLATAPPETSTAAAVPQPQPRPRPTVTPEPTGSERSEPRDPPADADGPPATEAPEPSGSPGPSPSPGPTGPGSPPADADRPQPDSTEAEEPSPSPSAAGAGIPGAVPRVGEMGEGLLPTAQPDAGG